MDKAILVTGGAGYVGSHVCKALASAGYLPVVLDNLSLGHRWAVKWGPLVEAGIDDGEAVAALISRYKPRACIHLAASAYVGESVFEPEKYYLNNVVGTLKLLQSLRANGVNRFILSSTCAVYGEVGERLITEDMPTNPINPYGQTKLVIEQALRDYQRAYGQEWTALRYFNAAGADLDGEIGEDHDPETHIIPCALGSAVGRRPPLEIYGTDYPTQDGTCIRDYIHVADLARAHVAALRRLEGGGGSLSLNLGSGRKYSVMQLVEAAERISGRPIARILRPRRPGDPACLSADYSLAKREIGFTPDNSDIDVVLTSAWRWYQKHFNLSEAG